MSSHDDFFAVDEAIVSILKDRPFEYVKESLGKWIVGEEANKTALFLSKLTYLTDNPTHEIIQGESGVGKTYLAMGVLDAFPDEDVIRLSRITPTWTDYSGEKLKNKIILLHQLGGLSSSTDTFHILMSEKGLSLGSVSRVGGEFESKQFQAEGPISLTSTVVNVQIDSQMESRSLIIVPDESERQTKSIQKQQAHFDGYPWKKEERRKEVKEVAKIVRHLRDSGVKDVVVPFSDLIELPAEEIRTRRDRPKIIALLKSLTFLRQMKREILERNGEKFVVAEWEDLIDLLDSCAGVISRTLTNLSDNEVEMIEKLQSEFGATTFTADDLTKMFPYAQSTIRNKLSGLRDKGVVSVQGRSGGRARKNQYALNVVDMDSSLLSELKTIEKDMVEKKIEEWKNNLGDVVWYHYDENGKITTSK